VHDVIGVGALNLDYIASASSHRRRDPDALLELMDRFEHGVESLVEPETIFDVVEQLGGRDALSPSLGGSAFLAIHALAAMRLGLRLGYVGVCGRSPDPTLSPLRMMDRLGIDRSRVLVESSRPCGICVSYIQEGERTLLTCLGANESFGEYARQQLDHLASYLASARLVHVTSFLDPITPNHLYELLVEAKHRSAQLIITLDPGHHWCVEQPAAVSSILKITDYLLVNYREFKLLGGLHDLAPDDAIAKQVLDRCGETCSALVLKRYDRILTFRRRGRTIVRDEYEHHPLGVDVIEDATGAGDVFAAGMLAAMASSSLQLELGAFLGMKMARHKLRHVGDRGYADFAQVASRFLREWTLERERELQPSAIFIAHGQTHLWRTVRDFLRDDLELEVHYFEEIPHDSDEITTALAEYLERCSFAVCVLTKDDRTDDGEGRARQNVIHEAGLFQGRYGFRRVALLVEDGCDVPSNISGLVRHAFHRQHIDQTFTNLTRHLRRERMLPPPHDRSIG
jgi:sugar/nucleoside kinase (ribokinase family)